jgi:DNA-binding transcriptional LysR family regulator
VDFRRLRYFLAVADHGGFTAASKAIFVAQPALSLAVKELERELGADLFVRRGRQVLLTSAGQALVEPARQALRNVETGRAAVAAVTGLSAGTLSLAALPSLASEPTAAFVGRFRRAHPAVSVELAAPADNTELLEMVGNGRCEVGITVASALPPEMAVRQLRSQELRLVFPPDSPPQVDPLPMWALDGVAMVASPQGSSTRQLLDQAFAEAGASPTVAVVSAQRSAQVALVLAGAGVALVPEEDAQAAARLGAHVARPSPPVTRQLVLVHRRGPISPAARRFVELSANPSAVEGTEDPFEPSPPTLADLPGDGPAERPTGPADDALTVARAAPGDGAALRATRRSAGASPGARAGASAGRSV